MPGLVGAVPHSGGKEAGGMKDTKLATAITAVGTTFIAVFMSGCGGGGLPIPIDLSPVGSGLTFLGLAIVLSAIIGLFDGPKK
jgi:hypothetical protein